MRDDRKRWLAPEAAIDAALKGDGITVIKVGLERQTVLSGDLNACLSLAGITDGVIDSAAVVTKDIYAVRQRRDRFFVVNGPELEDGWNEEAGVAVADLSSGYGVFQLSGPQAERLLSTGTEMSLGAASASVSRMWHGMICLLYKYQDEQTFRIHVRSGHAQAMWEMISQQINLLQNLELERLTTKSDTAAVADETIELTMA